MLAVIALLHLSVPGFLPADPPMHDRLLPAVPRVMCQICVGRPIKR
jgi:hypothetical protein